jgi:hypothetical protein
MERESVESKSCQTAARTGQTKGRSKKEGQSRAGAVRTILSHRLALTKRRPSSNSSGSENDKLSSALALEETEL